MCASASSVRTVSSSARSPLRDAQAVSEGRAPTAKSAGEKSSQVRSRWATGIGRCGPFSANSSAGVPNRYLGTMWYPRRTLIDAWPGPDVERVCAMPDDFLRAAGVDRFTAIITLTHDPRIDDMALMEALGLDAFYIGALGSQRTSARRRERLRELDLDEQQIARLHAPVGLDIGSKRPMEIAIAILAELIALRRGQS